jgi:hypothetical protein
MIRKICEIFDEHIENLSLATVANALLSLPLSETWNGALVIWNVCFVILGVQVTLLVILNGFSATLPEILNGVLVT